MAIDFFGKLFLRKQHQQRFYLTAELRDLIFVNVIFFHSVPSQDQS